MGKKKEFCKFRSMFYYVRSPLDGDQSSTIREESAGPGPLPPLRHPDFLAGCFPGSPQTNPPLRHPYPVC